MKKTLAAGFVLAVLMGVLAVIFGSSASAAAAPTCSGSQTSTITNYPDSGNHGNWAVDTTFTRTTTVKSDCSGVVVEDTGSFKTIPGADSPHLGLVLPSTALAGTFHGSIGLTFKDTYSNDQIKGLLLQLPTAVTSPTSSVTGLWADKLNATENNDWSRTYTSTSTCETWTDSATNGDGNSAHAGDIQGRSLCHVKPVTSSTAPVPPSNTTAPPVASNNGSTGTGSTGTVAQVKAPVGAPETGGGATAFHQSPWAYVVWALAVLAVGAVLYWRTVVRVFKRISSREG